MCGLPTRPLALVLFRYRDLPSELTFSAEGVQHIRRRLLGRTWRSHETRVKAAHAGRQTERATERAKDRATTVTLDPFQPPAPSSIPARQLPAPARCLTLWLSHAAWRLAHTALLFVVRRGALPRLGSSFARSLPSPRPSSPPQCPTVLLSPHSSCIAHSSLTAALGRGQAGLQHLRLRRGASKQSSAGRGPEPFDSGRMAKSTMIRQAEMDDRARSHGQGKSESETETETTIHLLTMTSAAVASPRPRGAACW